MKGFATGFLTFLLSLSIAALGVAFMLNVTILNADFVTSELEKFNAYSLAREQVESMFMGQIPQEFRPLAQEAIDTTLDDLEPWLKEQVRNALNSTYDYIKGKSESLTLVIQTEPVKASLKENLLEALQESPPPELAGIPPAMLEQALNQFIGNMMPSEFEITESMLPPEIMGILEQVRRIVGYIQIAFRASIVVAALSALGIILLDRTVRGSTRKLGRIFTIYGAIFTALYFAAKYFLMPRMVQPGLVLPAQTQAMIPQLVEDITAPLGKYVLSFLIAGVVLLIVSRVSKKRESAY